MKALILVSILVAIHQCSADTVLANASDPECKARIQNFLTAAQTPVVYFPEFGDATLPTLSVGTKVRYKGDDWTVRTIIDDEGDWKVQVQREGTTEVIPGTYYPLDEKVIASYDEVTKKAREHFQKVSVDGTPEEKIKASDELVRAMADSLRAKGFAVQIEKDTNYGAHLRLRVLRGPRSDKKLTLSTYLESMRAGRFGPHDKGSVLAFDPYRCALDGFYASYQSTEQEIIVGSLWPFIGVDSLSNLDVHERFHKSIRDSMSLRKNVSLEQARRLISFWIAKEQGKFPYSQAGFYDQFRDMDEVDARLAEIAFIANGPVSRMVMQQIAILYRTDLALVTKTAEAIRAGRATAYLRVTLNGNHVKDGFVNMFLQFKITEKSKRVYYVNLPGVSFKKSAMETQAEFEKRVDDYKAAFYRGEPKVMKEAAEYAIAQLKWLKRDREILRSHIQKALRSKNPDYKKVVKEIRAALREKDPLDSDGKPLPTVKAPNTNVSFLAPAKQ